MAVTGPIIPKFFTPSGSSAVHPISIGQFEQGEIFICLQTGRMWLKGRSGVSDIVRAVVSDIPFLNGTTSLTTTSGMRASTVGSGASEVASAELYGPIKIADSIRIPSLASATALATNADGQIVAATGLAPTDAQYIVMSANGSLTDERVLTAGNHVTVANSGGLATVDWNYNAAKRAILEAEGNATGEFLLQSSGTSATVSYAIGAIADTNHMCIARATTGSTSTGRAALTTATLDSIVLGTNSVKCCAVIRIPTLSTAADIFLVQFGLFDNLTAGSVDAVHFTYTHGTNAGDWTAECISNSVSTGAIDCNVAVVANGWVRLEIEINAAANQVLFKTDGTTRHTQTTTIPSGTARAMGFGCQIRKTGGSTGTTARTLDIDYLGITMEVTR